MENRYVVTGLTIIAIAVVFISYGIAIAGTTVIGVALSSMVVGVVLTVVGLTYIEPAEDLLKHVIIDLSLFVTKILEDMAIVGNYKFKICAKVKTLLISSKNLPCMDTAPGLGMVEDTPYMAIPIENLMKYIELVVGEGELIDKLKKMHIDILGICRGLVIGREENTLVMEMTNITEKGLGYAITPINLIRITSLAVIAHYTKSDVEIINEVLTENSYVVKIRVVGV